MKQLPEDERLVPLINAHNVDVRSAWLANSVSATRQGGRWGEEWLLNVDASLSKPEALMGVAMMLQVAELGWKGKRFRFRFGRPSDDPEVRRRSIKARQEYWEARYHARRLLITEEMLLRWEREETDVRTAAEEAGVTLEDLLHRVREWRRSRHRRPGVVDIKEYTARQERRQPPAPRSGPPPSSKQTREQIDDQIRRWREARVEGVRLNRGHGRGPFYGPPGLAVYFGIPAELHSTYEDLRARFLASPAGEMWRPSMDWDGQIPF